jgi:hypothetical protein
MAHEQAQCNKIEGTEIQTDRISYMYECPICNKQHRYAEPKEDEYVFCIGDDFGLYTPEIVDPNAFTDYEIIEE